MYCFFISLNLYTQFTLGLVTTASGAELRNFLKENGLSSLDLDEEGLLSSAEETVLSLVLDDDIEMEAEVEAPTPSSVDE